jgi:3'-phosphoadenosine 5'-phosphosulfate sulfotransferase (PAPS reductase)/FAD synthetase
MAHAEPILSDEDRECWSDWIEAALTHSRTLAFKRHVDSARAVLIDVLNRTPDCAVSWSGGKDSTVLTHLACVDLGARVRVYSEKDDLDYPGEEEYVTRLAREWELDLEILRPEISPADYLRANAAQIGVGGEIHARSAGLSKACFYGVMEAADARHDCSILGLRTEESGIRKNLRMRRGRYYQLANDKWRALPIADWSAIDVYAYAASRAIELLPVYRCIAFAHRDRPWTIRKSWWVPGSHAAHGGAAWLRRYYPSLYRQLCEWIPGSSALT